MKKKILFVMYRLSLGGAEKSLINLLSAFDYDQFDVDLLVFEKGGELERFIPNEVNYLDTPKDLLCCSTSNICTLLLSFNIPLLCSRLFYRNNNKFSGYRNNQQKWDKVYKQNVKPLEKKYDIAVGFLHSIVSYFVIDKVNADRRILWVHNDYDRLIDGKDFDYKYFSAADEIVTISEVCCEKLISIFPEFKNKITFLMNLNLPSMIKKMADEFFPEEYSTSIPNIVSIGRLSKQKRFDLAIRAAYELKNRGFSFNWFIIGDGELKSELNKLIDELSLNDCIKMLGTRVNPYPYVKNAYMVVQTSDFEGKSIIIDETKILAKAIISTNYDTVYDQIVNFETGLIVEKNPVSISNGIIELLENATLRTNIENNLTNMRYDYDVELKKYLDLFNDVL